MAFEVRLEFHQGGDGQVQELVMDDAIPFNELAGPEKAREPNPDEVEVDVEGHAELHFAYEASPASNKRPGAENLERVLHIRATQGAADARDGFSRMVQEGMTVAAQAKFVSLLKNGNPSADELAWILTRVQGVAGGREFRMGLVRKYLRSQGLLLDHEEDEEDNGGRSSSVSSQLTRLRVHGHLDDDTLE